MPEGRTLVVGLDAACWEYLNPLLAAGRLPVLAELMRNGSWGTLQSTMPPWTPTAWSSIITGKNPGKHGVYDMLWRRPGTYDFVPTMAQMRVGSPFWKYLNANGVRVGLVNIPHTQPPDPLDGFVVAGFGAGKSARELTYPSNDLQRIEAAFGPYEPTVDTAVLRNGTPSEILVAEREHQSRQVKIACVLAEHHDVDVLVINLMLLDHANHKMPTMDRVEQAIESCDEDLDRLLQAFHPDNVVLLSDHGSRRLRGRFLLHAWLCDHGYQVQTPRSLAEQTQALNWILVKRMDHTNGRSGVGDRAVRALLRQLVPRLPNPLVEPFWEMIERSIPFARDYVKSAEPVDYQRTRVYPGSIYSGLLYVNVVGRDPSGVVPGSERQGVIGELGDALAEVLDPDTGEPLFASVHAAEDLYHGPALAYAPDVILDSYHKGWNIQTGRFTPVLEPSRHQYFVGNQREHGWHSREGICVFRGPSFNAGVPLMAGHVMDVPATLLHLYGVSLPDDYDGRVLTEVFAPEFIDRHPVTHQPGDAAAALPGDAVYSSDEADEISGHLKALGYIE